MVSSNPNPPGPKKPVKVLLLAAGEGVRLRPITSKMPKCMVPIKGRPLLDYWFDLFMHAGLKEVRIHAHHLPELVREYIAAVNASKYFTVTEAFEPVLLGSAGTIRANRSFASDTENVLIVYADNLSNVNLSTLLNFHMSNGNGFTMMLFHTRHPEQCGIVELDEAGLIIDFVEKPKQPKTNLANAGVYVVTSDFYRQIADMDKFDIGFDVLPSFVGKMHGWIWDGYHLDIGTVEALERARQEAPLILAQGQAHRS